MKQTKKMTHIEVSVNQVTGIMIGWCIVFFLFPFFDHFRQSVVASISTVLFFISSYTRSYIIRRIFEGLRQ